MGFGYAQKERYMRTAAYLHCQYAN